MNAPDRSFFFNPVKLPFVALQQWAAAWHTDAVKQSVARKKLDLGLRHYTREELEAAEAAGETLDIQVLGLASIASDVTPELARRTIAAIHVLGALHASLAVKAALSDRMK
jgi:hypothetical protein